MLYKGFNLNLNKLVDINKITKPIQVHYTYDFGQNYDLKNYKTVKTYLIDMLELKDALLFKTIIK